MRSLILFLSLLANIVAITAVAQTGAAVVSSGPGNVGVAQHIKATATITLIDLATRTIALKTADGHELSVMAGPQVRNFAQMKVGDQVDVEYVEALTLDLKKGGGMTVARTDQAGAMPDAKTGARPAGTAARQVTIVADVVAVDADEQTVTLRGPQRTVDLKVRDPEQFKRIAVGDQVEATYTEAMAVAVRPAVKH